MTQLKQQESKKTILFVSTFTIRPMCWPF